MEDTGLLRLTQSTVSAAAVHCELRSLGALQMIYKPQGRTSSSIQLMNSPTIAVSSPATVITVPNPPAAPTLVRVTNPRPTQDDDFNLAGASTRGIRSPSPSGTILHTPQAPPPNELADNSNDPGSARPENPPNYHRPANNSVPSSSITGRRRPPSYRRFYAGANPSTSIGNAIPQNDVLLHHEVPSGPPPWPMPHPPGFPLDEGASSPTFSFVEANHPDAPRAPIRIRRARNPRNINNLPPLCETHAIVRPLAIYAFGLDAEFGTTGLSFRMDTSVPHTAVDIIRDDGMGSHVQISFEPQNVPIEEEAEQREPALDAQRNV